MGNKHFIWIIAALLTLCAACTSEDDSTTASITIISAPASGQMLAPTGGRSTEVTFSSNAGWTATTTAQWLTISPDKGGAGTNTVTITTKDINRTKQSRQGVVTINAKSARESVTIQQSGEFATFKEKTMTVNAEGGPFSMPFTTNCDIQLLKIYHQGKDWYHFSTRANNVEEYATSLQIDPNTEPNQRKAMFVLGLDLPATDEWVGLDTAVVIQSGIGSDYESTDYSADGQVKTMQQATKGKGIPMVIMGDGFCDKDIADGTYQTVMEKAMENLFSEEPVKSLRDYFTVHAVTAVSRNGYVGENANTAFGSKLSPTSSDIDADANTVMKYVRKVEKIDSLNTLAVVIVNSNEHNGVTYLYNNGKGKGAQYAIALCPIVSSLDSEAFRTVLVHEAIGHGLAKLADEYGYENNGRPGSDVFKEIETRHSYNWAKNIDLTSDPTKVPWKAFIGDSHYADEQIGVYEGGYTFMYDIFRPSENSMMKDNDCPFNAPSRKIIYDRVRALGEQAGESSHDDFTKFDDAHKPQQWSYDTSRTKGSRANSMAPWQFARPRIIVRQNW